MLKLKRSVRYVGLVALLGCVASPPIATVFGATPLGSLSGVSLDMRAAALRRIRPAATLNPYSGLTEVVGQDQIAYIFPANAASAKSLDDVARLQSVWATRRFTSADSSRAFWRSEVERLTGAYGRLVACARISGASPGSSVSWTAKKLRLQLSHRGPLNTGPEIVPDRVIYAVSSASAEFAADQTSIDCAELLRR